LGLLFLTLRSALYTLRSAFVKIRNNDGIPSAVS